MTGACAAACVAGAATAFSATAEPSEVTAYGSSGAAANLTTSSTVAAATFICTMTDSTGAKAQATVYASANNGQPYSPPGGGDPPVPPGGSPP
jgi:hypothetical protein